MNKIIILSLVIVVAVVSLGYEHYALTMAARGSDESKRQALRYKLDGIEHVIFYNIFLPSEEKNYQDALKVVESHMNQIGNLLRNSTIHMTDTKKLSYVLIGKHFPTPNFFNEELCIPNGLECTQHSYIREAFEEQTLHALYQYCSKHKDARVTYLHSKGTFHPRADQNIWREGLTRSALDNKCLLPPLQQCNVCGKNFHPAPLRMAGNMFTASCDYVRNLVPPLEFQDKMAKAAQKAQELWRDPNAYFSTQVKYGRKTLQESFMGIGRYANEHWITSHPDLVPCEVDENGIWTKAPTIPVFENIAKILRKNLDPKREDLNRAEYVLLPGKMFMWNSLYNGARPSNNSWFWEYYPDGKYFRDESNFTLK